MATTKRIYQVSDAAAASDVMPRLVRAATQAQAVSHAVRTRFTAEVPSQDGLVALVAAGVKVEEAGEEAAS